VAAVAASFADLLHRAGLPASPDRTGRLARALALTAPATVDDLYWVARVTMLADHRHLDVFDAVFSQVFRGHVDPAEHRQDRPAPPSTRSRTGARPPAAPDRPPWAGGHRTGAHGVTARSTETDDGREPGRDAVVGTASREERLATTDFADLDEDELRHLQALMRELRLVMPPRPHRRHRRHSHGDRLDVRATLRRSRRQGGDPVEWVTRRARQRPRRLVVLCDISGSMAPYARAYVQLLHATAGASRAEVFAFATQLTRLTRAVAVATPDLALARAAAAAPDWKGGTRIGAALRDFLDGYGRRGMARGAVVVIVSDGWEHGDPALLGEQMARLRRLAHRVVWVNPRTAAAGYQPLAGGMAAALPHCDAVVSGHTLAAMGEVLAALADPTGVPPRRAPAPTSARRPAPTS